MVKYIHTVLKNEKNNISLESDGFTVEFKNFFLKNLISAINHIFKTKNVLQTYIPPPLAILKRINISFKNTCSIVKNMGYLQFKSNHTITSYNCVGMPTQMSPKTSIINPSPSCNPNPRCSPNV